ncbi:MAG TPA: hypothetical protein VKE91_11445, partial [Blastocatellia bacterium]|nr:hypothetical protein [Blastocatellia bacterium]
DRRERRTGAGDFRRQHKKVAQRSVNKVLSLFSVLLFSVKDNPTEKWERTSFTAAQSLLMN